MMVSRPAEQEDWRRKYYDSVKAIEDEERQFRSQLRVMYKLVGRLCLAAQGQSPRLDQELARLKDGIRREAPGDHLDKLGQGIADAVHQMDHGTATLTGMKGGGTTTIVQNPPPVQESVAGDERVRGVLSRLLAELRREPKLVADADAIDSQLSVSLTRE